MRRVIAVFWRGALVGLCVGMAVLSVLEDWLDLLRDVVAAVLRRVGVAVLFALLMVAAMLAVQAVRISMQPDPAPAASGAVDAPRTMAPAP